MNDFKFEVGEGVAKKSKNKEGYSNPGIIVSRFTDSRNRNMYVIEYDGRDLFFLREEEVIRPGELSEDKQVYKTGKLEIYTKDKHGERKEIYYKENDDPWKLVDNYEK